MLISYVLCMYLYLLYVITKCKTIYFNEENFFFFYQFRIALMQEEHYYIFFLLLHRKLSRTFSVVQTFAIYFVYSSKRKLVQLHACHTECELTSCFHLTFFAFEMTILFLLSVFCFMLFFQHDFFLLGHLMTISIYYTFVSIYFALLRENFSFLYFFFYFIRSISSIFRSMILCSIIFFVR